VGGARCGQAVVGIGRVGIGIGTSTLNVFGRVGGVDLAFRLRSALSPLQIGPCWLAFGHAFCGRFCSCFCHCHLLRSLLGCLLHVDLIVNIWNRIQLPCFLMYQLMFYYAASHTS